MIGSHESHDVFKKNDVLRRFPDYNHIMSYSPSLPTWERHHPHVVECKTTATSLNRINTDTCRTGRFLHDELYFHYDHTMEDSTKCWGEETRTKISVSMGAEEEKGPPPKSSGAGSPTYRTVVSLMGLFSLLLVIDLYYSSFCGLIDGPSEQPKLTLQQWWFLFHHGTTPHEEKSGME
jgi:hypothetical protein